MKASPPSLGAVRAIFGLIFSARWIQSWHQQHRGQVAALPGPGRRARGRARVQGPPAPRRARRGFYQRIFCLQVTLWYLLFQRLNFDGTLAAVVRDLFEGGSDRLRRSGRRLSARVRSRSTSAYNQARQRIPEEFLQAALVQLRARLLKLVGRAPHPKGRPRAERRSWQLLDGSTLAMLWTPGLGQSYAPASNGRGRSDWCLMRVVVGFCLVSGAVLSAAQGAILCSEQALAWRLMAEALPFTIWIGDRNFGVWSVVAQALGRQQDVLVRLTRARATKLARGRCWHSGESRLVRWWPSCHDQAAPGTVRRPLDGHLIYARVQRASKGIDLWLFTTLDPADFSVAWLVRQYGLRWRVELHFRAVKTQMHMNRLEVASPAMARKEFTAGLLAYSLVRAVMYGAGNRLESGVELLSFNQARRVLVDWLKDWGRGQGQGKGSLTTWIGTLMAEVQYHRLPRRKKRRPSEPRRVRQRASKFPALRGSRAAARTASLHAKSA